MDQAGQLSFLRRAALAALSILGGCVPPAPAPSAYRPPPPPQPQPQPQPRAIGPTQVFGYDDHAGYTETVTLTPTGRARFAGKIDLAGPGCAGSLEGAVLQRGRVLILTNDDPAAGAVCRVDMTVRGRAMSIKETSCDYWHGGSCSFEISADLHRTR